MSDRTTLSTLTSASSRPVVVRELVCPACGGDIELTEGHLECQVAPDILGGLHSFKKLAELAVGEVIERRDA